MSLSSSLPSLLRYIHSENSSCIKNDILVNDQTQRASEKNNEIRKMCRCSFLTLWFVSAAALRKKLLLDANELNLLHCDASEYENSLPLL